MVLIAASSIGLLGSWNPAKAESDGNDRNDGSRAAQRDGRGARRTGRQPRFNGARYPRPPRILRRPDGPRRSRRPDGAAWRNGAGRPRWPPVLGWDRAAGWALVVPEAREVSEVGWPDPGDAWAPVVRVVRVPATRSKVAAPAGARGGLGADPGARATARQARPEVARLMRQIRELRQEVTRLQHNSPSAAPAVAGTASGSRFGGARGRRLGPGGFGGPVAPAACVIGERAETVERARTAAAAPGAGGAISAASSAARGPSTGSAATSAVADFSAVAPPEAASVAALVKAAVVATPTTFAPATVPGPATGAAAAERNNPPASTFVAMNGCYE